MHTSQTNCSSGKPPRKREGSSCSRLRKREARLLASPRARALSKTLFTVERFGVLETFKKLASDPAHRIALLGDTVELGMSTIRRVAPRSQGITLRNFQNEQAGDRMVRDRRRPGGDRRISRKLPWARHRSGARASARSPGGRLTRPYSGVIPPLSSAWTTCMVAADEARELLGVFRGSRRGRAFSRAHPSSRARDSHRRRASPPSLSASPPARAGRPAHGLVARQPGLATVGRSARSASASPRDRALQLADAREASPSARARNIRFTCPARRS